MLFTVTHWSETDPREITVVSGRKRAERLKNELNEDGYDAEIARA